MANTTLTGILTDNDGIAWALASWVASLILPAGSGKAVFKTGGNVPLSVAGRLDDAGTFTGTLPDTSSMLPTGCMWHLTIASLTSAPASTIAATSVVGGSFNMGAYASSRVAVPRIESSNLVYAYDAVEVTDPRNGDGYINTATSESFFWNGAAWVQLSGGSGSGTVQDGTHTIVPFYTENGDVVGPSLITSDATGANLTVPVQGILSSPVANISRTAAYPGGLSTSFSPTFVQFNGSASAFHGGGYSLGNLGGWTVQQSMFAEMFTETRGIAQGLASRLDKQSIGDSAGIYCYNFSDGGVTAPSDEGQTAGTFQSHEYPSYFSGNIDTTTGLGDINPTVTQGGGSNWITDGSILLNIAQGAIAATLNGEAASPGTFLQAFEITGSSLPLTTKWGVFSGDITPPTSSANFDSSVTITVTLLEIAGVQSPAFAVGDYMTIAGETFTQQTKITAVGAVSGSTQSITFGCHYPNLTSAYFFVGGIQGRFMVFNEEFAISGMPTTFSCFGSLTGTDLIYGFYVAGQTKGLPQTGNFAQSDHGTVDLYFGAEVVSNNDGHLAFTLETNRVNWTVGDGVINPHCSSQGGTGLFVIKEQFSAVSAPFGMSGISLAILGAGWSGSNVAAHRTNNSNPASFYAPSAGKLKTAPDFHITSGAFNRGWIFDLPPVGGSLFVFENAGAAQTLNIFGGLGTFSVDTATGLYHFDDVAANNASLANVGITTALTTSNGANVTFGTDGFTSNGAVTFQGQVNINDTIVATPTQMFIGLVTAVNGSDTSILAPTRVVTTQYQLSDGSAGQTGTFTTNDGKTVTYKGGIIVDVA